MLYYSKKEDCSEDEMPGALFISFEGEDTPNPTPKLQEPDLTFLMKFLVLEGK